MTNLSRNSIVSLISILAMLVLLFKFEVFVAPAYEEIYKSDYPNYFFAGKRWLSGEIVYSSIRKDVEDYFNWKEYVAYTADTPLTVILLSPFSLLDVCSGAVALNYLSIVLLISSISIFSRLLGFSLPHGVMFIALALSSMPFLFLLKKFHMESLLLFLGALGYHNLKKSRYNITGLIWGLAAAIKIFPVLWLVPYYLKKDKNAVFYTGLLSSAALTFISFVLLGKDNVIAFFTQVIPSSEIWYGTLGNYSLISFFTALIGKENAIVPAIIACLATFILFILKVSKANSDEQLFAISTCGALLISPLSWLNYYILVLPVLIMLYARLDFSNVRQTALFLFLFLSIWSWPDYIGTPWYFFSVVLSFMPMFALLSILLYFENMLSLNLPLRPNVCLLLMNNEGKLFLGERIGEPGVWQFPQGGVESGLSLEENVIKELHEETGAAPELFEIIQKLDAVHEYIFDNTPDYAKGKWRGQSQTFWLVKFKGDDSCFNLNRYHAEFSAFRWCKPEEVLSVAEPKRHKGYLLALEALKNTQP